MMIGIFQFLTIIYLVGYAWSIYWAYLIIVTSQGGHEEIKSLLGQNKQSDLSATTGGPAGNRRGAAVKKMNPYEQFEN